MYLKFLTLSLAVLISYAHAESANQTPDISQVQFADSLSFEIEIELADFELPVGLQNYAFAVNDNKCLLIAGRMAGLHGFGGEDSFPPSMQNTLLYVIDLKSKEVVTRSLADQSSGLTQQEIDYLSATAPEYYQVNNTLYLVGGYGVDSSTGVFTTKPILSAINIPNLMNWVLKPNKKGSAKQHIRQIANPIFQVAGGYLHQENPHEPFLLIMGQNYAGVYAGGLNGVYTEQIRTFKLFDDGSRLSVFAETYKPTDPNYRRRDLNVVPIIQKNENTYKTSLMVLSGVFTLDSGIWTVPVFIDNKGNSFMPSPLASTTFKQAMNNYDCATIGLYSKKSKKTHNILLGGLSYLTYSDGSFTEDLEIPFTNNISDIVIDQNGNMNQYILDATFPTILSTLSNPGNVLLFGASARFIPVNNLPTFPHFVFSLDAVKEKTLLGYVVGGIMSTLPNTSSTFDSAASPYIFSVYITPK